MSCIPCVTHSIHTIHTHRRNGFDSLFFPETETDTLDLAGATALCGSSTTDGTVTDDSGADSLFERRSSAESLAFGFGGGPAAARTATSTATETATETAATTAATPAATTPRGGTGIFVVSDSDGSEDAEDDEDDDADYRKTNHSVS